MINLAGEYILTADDIAHSLLQHYDTRYTIKIEDSTKMGFRLISDKGLLEKESDSVHEKSGVYAIFKDHHCLYAGQSGKSMGNRLGRFVKEVRRLSTSKEKHSAGRKYREMWGEDFSDMTVEVYYLKEQVNVKRYDVEQSMIRILKPLLNVRGR